MTGYHPGWRKTFRSSKLQQIMVPSPLVWGFPGGSAIKNRPAMQETRVRSLGWEHPLEGGMATHSSILAWRIPWTEESGGLWSIGSLSWM